MLNEAKLNCKTVPINPTFLLVFHRGNDDAQESSSAQDLEHKSVTQDDNVLGYAVLDNTMDTEKIPKINPTNGSGMDLFSAIPIPLDDTLKKNVF